MQTLFRTLEENFVAPFSIEQAHRTTSVHAHQKLMQRFVGVFAADFAIRHTEHQKISRGRKWQRFIKFGK